MGGIGSTRWLSHPKRLTVEHCLSLDINLWMREGVLREGIHQFGGWRWSNEHTKEEIHYLSYELNTINPASSWAFLHIYGNRQ